MKIKEMFPYLHVRNAAEAIDFYTTAFGAREKFRLTEPGGRIGHAELDFGGMTLMLADEYRSSASGARRRSAARRSPSTSTSTTRTKSSAAPRRRGP